MRLIFLFFSFLLFSCYPPHPQLAVTSNTQNNTLIPSGVHGTNNAATLVGDQTDAIAGFINCGQGGEAAFNESVALFVSSKQSYPGGLACNPDLKTLSNRFYIKGKVYFKSGVKLAPRTNTKRLEVDPASKLKIILQFPGVEIPIVL